MGPSRILSGLFRWACPDTTLNPIPAPNESSRESKNSQNSSNNIEPPPYESFSRDGIKATDIPQWLWSNKQCRSWVIAVCVTLLNNSVEEAEEKAARFRGFGPIIFENNLESWNYVLRDIVDATSVYGLVLGQTREKGAVPGGVSFSHWESGEREDAN